MSRSLQLAGNGGVGGTGRGGGGVRGAGQGLAALRCGQGRAGQAGGAAHAAEVASGTSGPGFKPGPLMFCCIALDSTSPPL